MSMGHGDEKGGCGWGVGEAVRSSGEGVGGSQRVLRGTRVSVDRWRDLRVPDSKGRVPGDGDENV
jgi:hypothetical protein